MFKKRESQKADLKQEDDNNYKTMSFIIYIFHQILLAAEIKKD
jgi:hypothetical protein